MSKKAALFDDDRAGAIYRTAAKMIYEKGFDATSMNEIAEAVQLTKPGLYYYVKGKKELLFSIMSFAMDLLDAEVVAVAKEQSDALERLRAIVRCHAWLLTQATGAIAILIDETRGLSDEQRVRITERKRAYIDFIRETLDRLRAEGRMRPVDTTTATFSLLGQIMWLARWFQEAGRMSREQVVDDVAEIALGGVLTDEAQAGAPSSAALPEAIPA
ncbi:MAG: TetR/AcrR family transcriptional regulator [Thermoanaerobaculia bacterium]|nr:TetR/AcrR family transcriptional regulator [Thermoanaerobaculia bacterium]